VTQRDCLSAEEVACLIRGTGTADHARHLAECEACARRVSFLRRVASVGVGRIADILAEVDDLVARLFAASRLTWWKLVLEPEYRRAEVARRLLTLAIDARFRDRDLAVDLAKAAAMIVDKLLDRDADEIADLRFNVWKFASAILREAGRYGEVVVAFVNAENAALAAPDPELALASVLLSRALFHAEPDVWNPEEAVALLDRAEKVFAQRGDVGRLQAAITVRATLLFRAGDAAAAKERWLLVLHETPETDRDNYLNALSNVALARVELRETGAALDEVIQFLLGQNERLGRIVQLARARWFQGRLHLNRGEYDAAVNSLRAAMAEIGDSDSSIRIGLDAIEALLLDERHVEAFDLARELASVAVALDQREPSRRHGLTAEVLVYLREASQRQALTADVVADVARYIDRITRQRPFDFVPPMPLMDM